MATFAAEPLPCRHSLGIEDDMGQARRVPIAERVRRYLLERSPAWVDRMILDDERLETLAGERRSQAASQASGRLGD